MTTAEIKALIDEQIIPNGEGKITAVKLNNILTQMLNTLGAEYQFAGVATPSTTPETHDAKVFYIANGKGTYTNFGGIVVNEDEVVILYWDGSWHKTLTGIASNSVLAEQKELIASKADKGGRYPAMSVGSAEALVSRGSAVAEEFLTKIASASGASEVKALKGNSLVWNQHASQNWVNWSSTSIVRVTDKSVKVTLLNNNVGQIFTQSRLVNGHKYLWWYDELSKPSEYSYLQGVVYKDGVISRPDPREIFTHEGATDVFSLISQIYLTTSVASADYTISNPQVIDLTQMFGAGKEPSTYAEFLARSPKVADPFAYNEGEIVSSNPMGIKSTGRNIWDEEWEKGRINTDNGEKVDVETEVSIRSKNFIRVCPNVDYYLMATDTIFGATYDADKNYVGELQWAPNSVKTFSNGVRYIRFYIGWNGDGHRIPSYKNDICINVSDPSFNGTYEPYDGHLLPMDLSAIKKDGVSLFPNGLLSAGTAYDEVRKNKAFKRIGAVNLEDLEFVRNQGSWFYPWENFGGKVSANTITENGYTTSYNGTYLIIEAQVQPTGKLLFELAEPIVVDVDFNGVFLTTQNGMVEVLDSVPMKADIVEAKDYVDGIEKSSQAYIGILASMWGIAPSKVGVVNMGSLAWAYGAIAGGTGIGFTSYVTDIKGADATQVAKILCSLYTADTVNVLYGGGVDKAVAGWNNGGRVLVIDSSYTDADTFKKAMDGIFLFYEKA